MHKPKAYSYVRISSKGQISGSGISRQIEKAREYALENGLELDDELQDIGRSGFSGAHVRFGALGSFLGLVRDNKIPVGSYLLVESLDRLSREDVLIAQAQFIEILSAGIYVVTLIDGMVYHKGKDFTQLIISLTYMSRANNESAEKSKRVRAAIRKRKLEAAEGKPRYNHHLVGWIDQIQVEGSKDYEFCLNEKAASVRRIFELADQGVGAHTIARILNEEGLPVLRKSTNASQRWKDASVWLVIKNELCVGTYQAYETVDGQRVAIGNPIPHYYPAAVDEELFWRVQRKRSQKKAVGAKGRTYSNLFARNTACAHCGRVLRYSRGGNEGNYVYYLSCQDRLTNAAATCPPRFYRYGQFEDAVLLFASDFHAAAMDLHFAGKMDRKRLSIDIDEISAALVEIDRKRSNAMAMGMTLDSAEDRANIANMINDLRKQMEDKKAQKKSLESRLNEIDDDRQEMTALAEQIKQEQQLWKTSTDANAIYESRARVANMLNEFISLVEVDFEAMEATVWIAGFTSAYRFNKDAELIGHINLVAMLRPLGDRAFIVDREDGTTQLRKPNQAHMKPALNEAQMIAFMQLMGLSEDRQTLALEAAQKMVRAAEDHVFRIRA